MEEKGANVQRVLWASTSTKNPSYSDIKYVTELIGRNTVNTLPENTLQSFLDHGIIEEALTAETSDAQATIDRLRNFGIDIDNVCAELLQNGVLMFEKSFAALLASIETKVEALRRSKET